ncbi:MAG: hypothetical protein IKH65_06045 [Clostridia bacterium]|nr:hypothetical protein [Clostridia bacterium]
MTYKECVNEYSRVMNSVDMTPEFRQKLIDKCISALPANTFPYKTVIAVSLISGVAIAATTIGIKTYMGLRKGN